MIFLRPPLYGLDLSLMLSYEYSYYVSTLVALALLTSCTQTQYEPPAPPILPAVIEPTPSSVPEQTLSGSTASGATSSAPRTRTEVVTYQTPANNKDPIEFSVTVMDGVIVGATATAGSPYTASLQWQEKFATGITQASIGKKAADLDLDLDVVGGASLTTAAFEQFVRSF